jgi:hypothetical protein
MKPLLDQATEPQTAGNANFGACSVTVGSFRPGLGYRATSMAWLQSLPPSDRERSSARAIGVAAPAPGPGGVIHNQVSRLEEANREWLVWRFGDDD